MTRIDCFPIYCGINYPEMMVDEYFKGTIGEYRLAKTDSHWIDLYADIKNSFFYFYQENIRFKNYLKPYLNKNKVFAVLNKEDLLPFVMMLMILPLKYFRILKRGRRKKTFK